MHSYAFRYAVYMRSGVWDFEDPRNIRYAPEGSFQDLLLCESELTELEQSDAARALAVAAFNLTNTRLFGPFDVLMLEICGRDNEVWMMDTDVWVKRSPYWLFYKLRKEETMS